MTSDSLELVFATHNLHKVKEVAAIIGSRFIIKSLSDLSFFEDIPETADTISGNALQKARFVFSRFHCNCFADDTGLIVEALDNRPGVYSARYAGENASYEDNVRKLLKELEGKTNRKAAFVTVIAVIIDGKEHLFEGRIEGEIIKETRGTGGFGYDPVFLPAGSELTFAEMEESLKNKMSHRAVALNKMLGYFAK